MGPQDFGIWNYIIASSAFFAAFSSLGIESILVRELIKTPEKERELLGSSFILKLIGGFVSVIASVLMILILDGFNHQYVIFSIIVSSGFIFQSTDVIDYFFQAKVESKRTIKGKGLVFLITSLLKILLIISDQPLSYFVILSTIEILMTAIVLVLCFLKAEESPFKWKWESSTAKSLLSSSWPLALSSVVIMLYMRLDQVMLGQMQTITEVGIYTAAVKLCEIWYFIPMIICSSIYPGILKSKDSNPDLFRKSLMWLYFSFFWFSLCVSCSLLLFDDLIIDLLYGDGFEGANRVLVIYGFSLIPTFLGIASSQYLMAFDLTRISLYRTILGLSTNLLLNLYLVPEHGAIGAAWATLISYNVATFSLFAFKSTRLEALFIIKSTFLNKA